MAVLKDHSNKVIKTTQELVEAAVEKLARDKRRHIRKRIGKKLPKNMQVLKSHVYYDTEKRGTTYIARVGFFHKDRNKKNIPLWYQFGTNKIKQVALLYKAVPWTKKALHYFLKWKTGISEEDIGITDLSED